MHFLFVYKQYVQQNNLMKDIIQFSCCMIIFFLLQKNDGC